MKKSVRKGIWYLGGKKKQHKIIIKRRQKEKGFPIGLIGSAAAPLLVEIAKPIFKAIFSRGKRKRRWQK